MLYKLLIRPILFLFDPEGVHNFSFGFLRLILRIPGISGIIRSIYSVSRPELHTHLKDISLQNPIGLAAGFDKNALLGDQWGYWGFGFIEVGTVTPRPQDGNPKQRLFRLPKDKAVINRMGFNNAGLDALVTRLKRRKNPNTIIGANIGKNKDTPNEQAVDDYLICFKALFDYVDYFVVNVSSPNTPGLRSLQQKEPLTQLLQQLQNENQGHTSPKPLLLKIAPDLTHEQLDDILEVVATTQLDGLIATNTTISREGLTTDAQRIEEIGAGGLSGRPLTERSTEMIRYLREKAGPELLLIGVGGIMSPQDARDRLAAGANLIQVYTGFVYEGPGFINRMLKAL